MAASRTETSIRDGNSQHQGLNVISNSLPLVEIARVRLYQVIELAVDGAVVNLAEVDSFLGTCDKAGKHILVLQTS